MSCSAMIAGIRNGKDDDFMRLHLIRHGEALESYQDPERGLSPAGIAEIKRSASVMSARGLTFDVIVASTKKRARQTAEIVAEATGYDSSIVETDCVTPNAPPALALSFLEQYRGKKSILVAGHLPSLPDIAGALLADRTGMQGFHTGSHCCIDTPSMAQGSGELKFQITP